MYKNFSGLYFSSGECLDKASNQQFLYLIVLGVCSDWVLKEVFFWFRVGHPALTPLMHEEGVPPLSIKGELHTCWCHLIPL